MSDPRNVDDVAYVDADLSERPMREVLKERAKSTNRNPRSLREESFRKRAGIIGALQSCLCCWPIAKAETETEHEDFCPAHGLLMSIAALDER